MSHARISRYASRWSRVGIKVAKGFGLPERSDNITGRAGSVEKFFAYSGIRLDNCFMSAFGETM